MGNAAKKRPLQARAAVRRRSILEAALQSFTELGFGASTVGDICKRSRASTGSVYHLFGSKEALAAELYLEGVAEYQRGFLAVLSAQPRAREGLYAVTRYHLGWVREHPAWARYLLQMRRAGFTAATEVHLSELNRDFGLGVGAWILPHVQRHTLRRFAPDLFTSILLGPCQEFSRQWLAGRCQTDLDVAARELGRAAWRVLAQTRE